MNIGKSLVARAGSDDCRPAMTLFFVVVASGIQRMLHSQLRGIVR